MNIYRTDKTTRLCGLYAITDPKLTPPENLLVKAEAALQGGAKILQYRDKSDDKPLRSQQAAALLALCQRYNATLIINDDVELTAAVNAHGVHLGLTDTAITEARHRLGSAAIIGATCHASISNAKQAIEAGADYVAFGRFFPSSTKPDAPPADLSDISAHLGKLEVPAVAIGGITLANAPKLTAAGFTMVAVVADIFSQTDIIGHCKKYAELFDQEGL